MFKLLFGILIFFGFILLITGVIGIRFIRALFGFGKRPSPRKDNSTDIYTTTENKDKIFGKNEGEYVEFEEIEDEDS